MNMKRVESEGVGDNDGFFECDGVSAFTLTDVLCDTSEATKESILDAVKLIAKLKPEKVEPFSLGDVGGVKIISSPHVPQGSIVVSDDIYLLLQELSNT